MEKKEFYVLFNYGTQNENLVKMKGWEHTFDNGVVVFIAKNWCGSEWTSYEGSTGNYIVSRCKTKKECLDETSKHADRILDALKNDFNTEKAKALKNRIEIGKFEEWF